MTTRRVAALVLACLLVLPGIGFLYAGGGLVLTFGVDRDPAGYVTSRIVDVSSPTSAVVAKNVGVIVDAGTPDWVLSTLDADLRLTVRSSAAGSALFVGVGPADGVAAYLAGAPQDQVTSVAGSTPTYLRIDGVDGPARPSDPAAESFWLASASGTAPLTLDWAPTRGDLVLVLMNADGAPGLNAAVTGGAKSGALPALAWTSLGLGAALLAAAAALFLLAARDGRAARQDDVADVADVEPDPAGVSG